MIETLGSLVAGSVIGLGFFGGLWWTVRRGLASRRPAAWFLGSRALRSLCTVAGFSVVSGGDGLKLSLCLLGFLVARTIVIRQCEGPWEARHAPRTR